jgi:hypothetical protein
MTPRRAEFLAALSGLVLLIVTAVAWYAVPGGSSVTAWQAFHATDVVLALAGATALLFGIAALARPAGAFAVPTSAVVSGLGWIAALLVAIRLLNPPDDLTIKAGAWLGLAVCLVIGIAGWYGMREETPPSASTG